MNGKECQCGKIKILELRLLPGDKPLKAFCDIEIGDWVIRDFRIVKQNGQKAFVSSPQVSWKEPATGEIRYRSILTIPPEEKQAIDLEVLRAFQVELERRNERSK